MFFKFEKLKYSKAPLIYLNQILVNVQPLNKLSLAEYIYLNLNTYTQTKNWWLQLFKLYKSVLYKFYYNWKYMLCSI